VNRRSDSGGLGLHRLRPADFKAFRRRGGVERLVLRLEWSNGDTALCEDTTERSRKQRLADVRGGAENHDGAGGHAGGSTGTQFWS
jgi:hypothetical protein